MKASDTLDPIPDSQTTEQRSVIGRLIRFFQLFHRFYAGLLEWSIRHKLAFLSIPCILLAPGGFTLASGTLLMDKVHELTEGQAFDLAQGKGDQPISRPFNEDLR